MGRKSNKAKIIELLKVDHELVNYKDEYTDFGMCWMHKETGKYFTHEGLETESKFLLKHKIDKHITSGLGFSTEDQKWYGWSHRALYSFGIESEVKKGDCAFNGNNINDIIENTNNFWDSEYHICTNTSIEHNESENKEMMYTKWKYNDSVPSKSLHNQINGVWTEIPEFGKGEWTAKTLEDAKQMAIDFAESVS